MAVTSSEELVTLDDWHVVCGNSHEAELVALADCCIINCDLQSLSLDRR